MFSQYSWWDFIKVVIVLAIPYYAFVLWKYYREDIRDWFNSRGQKTSPVPTDTSLDEEEDTDEDTDLYAVKNYSNSQPAEPLDEEPVLPPSQPVSNSAPAEVVQTKPNVIPVAPPADVAISEGIVVNDEPSNGFELALKAEPIRSTERSLADVINAAKRMSADEQGVLSATDTDDTEAAELATVINKQKGIDVLSGVTFNR